MIKGQQPTTTFVEHPEGRFNGIVYAWEFLGEKEDRWGNTKKRAMLRIESLDEFIQDGEAKGKPFTVAIFHNIAFGDHERRTGNYMPLLQKLRESILDRTISDPEEWYNFDPHELMGARVRYRVSHAPKGDGSGGNWVNAEILERLDDQEIGEQVNETFVKEPGDEAQTSAPPPSRAPAKPTPKSPPVSIDKVDYCVALIGELKKAGHYDEEAASGAIEWVRDPHLSVRELEDWFPDFESFCKEQGIEKPAVGVHPMTQDEDIPF